jgi:hypothetical protein
VSICLDIENRAKAESSTISTLTIFYLKLSGFASN